MQTVRQGDWLKVCEEKQGDKASDLPGRPVAWDPSQEVTECLRASRMCETFGSSDPTDLAPFGEEEDNESVRLKEYFSWWEPGHNENEYGNFPTDPGEKCVQRRTGKCTGASEQDTCLLHEDDSDQSIYSCPSPTDDLAASLSLQVWFDMEALGAHVCDNLDAIATTVQNRRTTFRSDVQIEPPEEVPDNSGSVTSVDTRKVERKFAVGNVTELMVDDGQQADRGRKTRLIDVDGLVRSVKSARRVEKLLRNVASKSYETRKVSVTR